MIGKDPGLKPKERNTVNKTGCDGDDVLGCFSISAKFPSAMLPHFNQLKTNSSSLRIHGKPPVWQICCSFASHLPPNMADLSWQFRSFTPSPNHGDQIFVLALEHLIILNLPSGKNILEKPENSRTVFQNFGIR